MKLINILERLHEHLENHPEDDMVVFNLLSILRGPDGINGDNSTSESSVKTHYLKYYTVARIRGYLGVQRDLGLDVVYSPLSENEIKERDKLLLDRDCIGHFSYHYTMAILAVARIYRYNLETEKEII